ncbi:MAG: two-component sensor histidine kinase [Myxococcales bacterium]|nr:two-component sensor histidine kinase [Myxococcales bacterium]
MVTEGETSERPLSERHMPLSRLRDLSTFHRTALLGFAAAITIFAVGMAIGMRSMRSELRAQAAQLRAEQREFSLTEKLRWKGDRLATAARSYVSGDASQLPVWRVTAGEFDRARQAFVAGLRDQASAANVVQSATEFARAQSESLAAVERTHDVKAASGSLEREALPAHRRLNDNVDVFVNRAEGSFRAKHQQAEQALHHLVLGMNTLLAVLIISSVGVAWYFARHLSRAYGKEQMALQAAEQAIAARDELMGVVAHDLRNPLAAISMKAAVLGEGAESDKTRKQAQSIENVTMRMDYLIKTMLDVVTIEASHFSVKPTAGDAEDLMREIADMFGTVAEAKQILLAWKVTPPRIRVCFDRERVLQVLTNLVGNALKFTPQGGRVTMTVDVADGRARFGVSDTGHGIAGEDLPRVFDRFWRKGGVSQKGTGLGLFIAKSIVVAHGGKIWVESELGHGSTFYFTLALAPPTADVAATEQGGPVPA